MRSLMAALAGVALLAGSALAAKVEVKGPHICCKQCVRVATGLLEKVDGVSEASADAKTKMVTFTAKDEASARAGFSALLKGGFYGSGTIDGKEIPLFKPVTLGDKADVVTVKDVHVCCGQCQKGIEKIFPDAKVSYEGTGPQKTVRIESANRTPGAVLEALNKGGFNGTPAK